jgi:alkanesulfonate monooxygenase
VAAAVGAGANTTALVGTPEQVADALADYHALGVDTFLIRGFDPLEDAIDYGKALIPRVRELVAAREDERPARAG